MVQTVYEQFNTDLNIALCIRIQVSHSFKFYASALFVVETLILNFLRCE